MKNRNLKIRPMRAADTKAVCKMMQALAALSGDKANITERDLLRHALGKNKVSTVFIAIRDAEAIGFSITRDYRNFYIGVKIRHIDFIFVTKEYRRAGIGAALINYAFKDGLKAGCSAIDLDAAKDNKIAQKLYKKCGFQKRAHVPVRYRMMLKK